VANKNVLLDSIVELFSHLRATFRDHGIFVLESKYVNP
jgi:hypothetical protein